MACTDALPRCGALTTFHGSHDARYFKKVAMVGPLRLVGAVLLGRGAWCDGIHRGGQLLCRTCASGMGAAGLVVRAGVDGFVRDDGSVGLVGVAPWGMDWCARGADTVRRAAGAQWAMELVVLCVAFGGMGVRGHRGAMACAGGDHRGVCEEASSGGVVVGAVSGMGELCGCAQLFGVATQSSGARLISLRTLVTCIYQRDGGDDLLPDAKSHRQ